MKMKSLSITACLCLLGLVSVPAFADTQAAAQPNEDQLIKKLSDRTEELQSQVGELQKEIKKLKVAEAKQASKTPPATVVAVPVAAAPAVQTATDELHAPEAAAVSGQCVPQKPMQAGTPQCVPVHLVSDEPTYLGGTPITTSPYLGTRSTFNASDLITNIPSVNEDLRLITQVEKLKSVYKQQGWPFPTHPFVDISGQIQAAAFPAQSRSFNGQHSSDLNVTDAELDTAIVFNPWITGFMTVNFDPSSPAIGPQSSNSRFFMDRGFLTIGNLEKAPVYVTAGQFYVPFGQYSNSLIDNPITKVIGQIKARAITLGYDNGVGIDGVKHGLNAAIYGFKGDSYAGNSSQINQLGGNVNYTYSGDKWNGNIAAGYITNMADTLGIQQTGGPSKGFNGFGGNNPSVGTENLVHRVPAFDTYGSIGVGNFSLVAEYLTALSSFSRTNMTFNSHGAKPSALDSELSYNIPFISKPTTFTIAYDQSQDALALLVPKNSYFAVLNTSIWKDTIEALEYRHDINYGGSSKATGQGVAVVTSGLGHTADTVMLAITAYF